MGFFGLASAAGCAPDFALMRGDEESERAGFGGGGPPCGGRGGRASSGGQSGSKLPHSKEPQVAGPAPANVSWPHAPVHRLAEAGTFIVTSGTYQKIPVFRDGPLLKMLHRALLEIAVEHAWQLEAWAVFPNHYHFVGHSPPRADSLVSFLRELHSRTTVAANRHDGTPGRQVWHNYWETTLTLERSYFARLHYVHQNPVRHGIARVVTDYPYGSAAWFERMATPAQVATVYSFKVDRVNVRDDF